MFASSFIINMIGRNINNIDCITDAIIKSNNNTVKYLENFASHNREMNLIANNIYQTDMTCQEPINKYNLFLSLLIILLLAHILVGLVYKNK